jgi:hypothetical protein
MLMKVCRVYAEHIIYASSVMNSVSKLYIWIPLLNNYIKVHGPTIFTNFPSLN